MDLTTAANLATTVAVVVGVVFGLLELRHAVRDRHDLAAVEVVRSVDSPEIRRAVIRVLELPHNATPDQVSDDPQMRDAALLVYWAAEMFGSIVYEGVIDLHTLDRMHGGWVRGCWLRLRLWMEAERIKSGSVNTGEWWQWLYQRLEADPDPGKKLGAHIAYRDKAGR